MTKKVYEEKKGGGGIAYSAKAVAVTVRCNAHVTSYGRFQDQESVAYSIKQ